MPSITYPFPVNDTKIGGAIINGDRCFYCKCLMYQRYTAGAAAYAEQVATSDHYVPYCVTDGLAEQLPGDKRVMCCSRCNGLKADKPADIYEYFVRQNDMRQPAKQLRMKFTRFAYLLMAVGFKTAMHEALDHRIMMRQALDVPVKEKERA